MRGTRDVTKHSGVQGRVLRAARLGPHSCNPSTRMREVKDQGSPCSRLGKSTCLKRKKMS